MSRKVRGRTVGGAESGGGETLECSTTLIVEDLAMRKREYGSALLREKKRRKFDAR